MKYVKARLSWYNNVYMERLNDFGRRIYVHAGGEYTLLIRSIIGIFDMENITRRQKSMIRFLSEAEKQDRVEYVSEEIPKSIIVTRDRVYLSPISIAVLQKRMAENFLSQI